MHQYTEPRRGIQSGIKAMLDVRAVQHKADTVIQFRLQKKGKEESMNLICIGATATLPQATIQLQIIMPQNFENGYLDCGE